MLINHDTDILANTGSDVLSKTNKVALHGRTCSRSGAVPLMFSLTCSLKHVARQSLHS